MKLTRSLLAAAGLTLLNACADSPVAPDYLTVSSPNFNFSNGPDDLSNVIRFNGAFFFGIQDPKTDLTAIAGLPVNPKTSIACGGTEPFAEADIQHAGVRQEVIHLLATSAEMNLHVYTRSSFRGFCRSTPIATGSGRGWVVDNDLRNDGPGANSWGFHMGGEVTLTDGSKSNLEAHNRFIISPEGEFRRIHRQVRLSR